MGVILLKVVDETGQEVDINELTGTGILILYGEINQLKDRLDEVNKI